ncbi:hypothetical protein L1049_025877 [Liquidambar formosana]|uniref:TMEM205-like domain-containing protein n=1 Tax=Liquidambar formosana TaxID=63359 RepID=A0AAP0R6R7_LIQFO
MMNLLAICLVVTSVATAGVWSPSPERKNPPGEDVIVKEGHRIIVVEYEKEGIGNTKVSISPQEAQAFHKNVEIDDKTSLSGAKEKLSSPASSASGVVENAKEKIKEASSVLPNLGHGLSGSQPPSNGHSPGPRELICDAFGKCKHKITGAFGRAKEKVTEKAHEVGEEAKEAVDIVGDTFDKVKETVSQKARGMEQGAKETVDKAKHTAKTIGEDIARNISEKTEMASQKAAEKAKEGKEKAERAADRVKDGAHKIKEESKKDLSEVMRRGREVAYDAVTYVVSAESVGSFAGVIHLMGFAMAYGMCVWITFISSYVLAGVLPRQQFGMVQSKIYPVYFRAMAYGVGVALLGHLLSQRKRWLSSKADLLEGYNLVVSLLMVVINLKYLEPRATKVLFERMKVEKEEGRGKDGFSAEPSRVVEPPSTATKTSTTTPATAAASQVSERLEQMVKSRIVKLNERLKKLNSYSSFLNILTLMALSWHLVYLGQRLHMAC